MPQPTVIDAVDMAGDRSMTQKAWSLSSPIHRLPDEVLSHIFRLCLTRNHESNESQMSPRLFTHICKRWTNVALAHSGLWCNISMTFPLTPAQLLETNILLLRSKTHPIDIQLDFRDPQWDWEEETHQFGYVEMSLVIRTLLPHVARWRRLAVLTDTWLPMFCFLFTTSCSIVSAPMLRSLSLSRCNAYFAGKDEMFKPESHRPPLKLFGGVPLTQLRNVSLVGVHIDWSRSHLVNLHQLELKYHASDVMPSLREFLDIFSACPDLTKLSIIGSGPRMELERPTYYSPGPEQEPEQEQEPEPAGTVPRRNQSPAAVSFRPAITLDRLTRFAFGFVDVTHAVNVLSLFGLPALREMEIEDVSLTLNPYEERDASAVLKFLTNNRVRSIAAAPGIPLAQITSLELRGLCAGRDDFSSFFSHMTSLERLVLSDTSDEAVLSLNSRSHAPEVICPALKVLHCRDMDSETVVETVVERSGIGARKLKRLILEYRSNEVPVELAECSTAALLGAGVGRFALYTNGRLCQEFSRS
ncbi:hypothetical protein AX14_011849 [Amanita brunnescens Koide BX004]|nr:hypothetical protein AX14_011849 [Amanita brunnescens Koide BX004]